MTYLDHIGYFLQQGLEPQGHITVARRGGGRRHQPIPPDVAVYIALLWLEID